LALGLEPAVYLFPRFSSDGTRLAYSVSQGANTDLWIYELQRGSRTRLTRGGSNWLPVWSADGQFLVFQSAGGLQWTRTDGAGKPQTLL
jgi:Tol biopolymer transport system component